MKLSPFRTPARNGALLYMTYGNVSVRSARPLPESLTCYRSRQLVRTRGTPLAPLCGYPHNAAASLSPCWSCEAWSRTDRCVRLDAKRPVRGLGEPQQAASEYRKRYSGALLAYVRVYSLYLPFVYVIMHTKLRRRIGICGDDTELLRGCFHEIS